MFRKDESGFAVPLTLIIILVLTLLGVALLAYSVADSKQVAMDENNLKAHYVARSGAHAMVSYLSKYQNSGSATDLINSPESNSVQFGDGEYKVLVYGDPASELHILSTGNVNDAQQSVLVAMRNTGVDSALYANHMTFEGAAGAAGEIRGGDIVYGGDLAYFDPNIHNILIDGEMIFEYIPFDPVVLPCNDPELLDGEFEGSCPASIGNITTKELIINKTVAYGNITIQDGNPSTSRFMLIEPNAGDNLLLKADTIFNDNGRIIVRLNNSNVIFVVDTFINMGKILVQSVNGNGGHLLIYVHDYNKGLGGGNREVLVDDGAYLNVYVTEGGTFNIAGTPNFVGSIYAPDADSVLAGDAQIVGWVITDVVLGEGGMSIQFQPTKTLTTSMDLDFYKVEAWRYDN